MKYYIGVDEVGRGPIAGPVTVCALVSFAGRNLELLKGVKDSKKLTPRGREIWFKKIRETKVSGLTKFVVISVDNKTIDKIGIVSALNLCVKKCLDKLDLPPEETSVLLDGSLHASKIYKSQETIIRGDEKEPLIAAASIVAKVSRDWHMSNLPERYKTYGFQNHKGYGTRAHYAAIKEYGISDLHRRSFLK